MLGRLRSIFRAGVQRWVPLSAVDSIFGRVPAAGAVTDPAQALSLSPYWCGVRLYQTTLGSLPLRLHRRTPAGGWEPVPDGDPDAVLMDVAPNPAMTRAVFWELLAKDLIHEHGEAFALVRRDGAGRLVGLYPISPRHVVQVAIDREWRKAFHVIDPLLGEQHYLDDEVVHLVGYSLDGFRGVRLLHYAAEALGLHKQIQQAAGASYRNAVRPSGYLSFPDKIEKGAIEQIKAFFAEAYAGVANAGKVPVLTAGGKFEKFDDHSADDAKILDALGSSVDDVARWLGVSPLLLFNLARGTYSNLGAERSAFYTRSMRPLVGGIELELNRKAFPAGDRWAEFDAEEVLRGDPTQQSENDSRDIQAGWKTRAEVRERRGLPPLPGLGRPLMPQNMLAVGGDGRPEPVAPANAPNPGGVPAL
jgi:HK97 family phage portal protein